MGDSSDEGRSLLIDVSDVSLEQLSAIEDTVIGDVIRRFLDEADGPQPAAAGFDAFVEGEPAAR
ncbi:FxSxx-COOH cyclophane-containing RiPP peptide [Actinomadura rifamycini]|uniref:FxSxx-COOH cyclophane-containing RiPP peptide n=1 Tax=Actinomadura rifamycini TaxID=31962 RepID=UPI00040908C4|nr:FxSxx-COOH cyclophane-containing RiPP peptide [Actinomadura rifamycini]